MGLATSGSLPDLTAEAVRREASVFIADFSLRQIHDLYGATDGKRVGTAVEHAFRQHLRDRYTFEMGNSGRGLDIPGLGIDIKSTSKKLPQSTCPFRSARQKIYGLGYDLLVFIYDKVDDHETRSARLNIEDAVFIDRSRTADAKLTKCLRYIVETGGGKEDILALFDACHLPVDGADAEKLAEDILTNPPAQGILTISNALQWRVGYSGITALPEHGVFRLI